MNETPHYSPIDTDTLFEHLRETKGTTRQQFDEVLAQMKEQGILADHHDGGYMVPGDIWGVVNDRDRLAEKLGVQE